MKFNVILISVELVWALNYDCLSDRNDAPRTDQSLGSTVARVVAICQTGVHRALVYIIYEIILLQVYYNLFNNEKVRYENEMKLFTANNTRESANESCDWTQSLSSEVIFPFAQLFHRSDRVIRFVHLLLDTCDINSHERVCLFLFADRRWNGRLVIQSPILYINRMFSLNKRIVPNLGPIEFSFDIFIIRFHCDCELEISHSVFMTAIHFLQVSQSLSLTTGDSTVLTVLSGSFRNTSISALCICWGVPSKNLPQPPTKRVSPKTTIY